MLDQEIKTYERLKKKLLKKAKGKFVLIKGSEKFGIFDTEIGAIKEGYSRFGKEDFLVQEICEEDIPCAIY